ncbi:MAG: VacJ family lipoprotein [Chromatiales bacterium]|nr:VacJ family lipoprotein [Gammaproteobacteria bacterium]MBW6476221.1 VacJ family lipoprotein [Chromatiales bacterium]
MPRPAHLLLLCALLLSGCASTPAHTDRDPRDPLESYNRAVHAFNEDVDRALFQPLARGYEKVVPRPINNGISNFFSNIGDIWVMVNNLLQGKPGKSASDLSRIVWNTTIGLGGFIDVASHMDLPKHNEDFGQTLGVWGVGPGPYFVLPFLGPSTIRDTGGRAVQWYKDPLADYVSSEDYPYLIALNLVDTRASMLRTTRLLDSASLDSYSFMRDAYLQRREYLIHDGNPPEQEVFDPFADEPLPPPR